MKKYLYYGSIIGLVSLINGCTGTELSVPQMVHNPIKGSTKQQPNTNKTQNKWQQPTRKYYPPTSQKEVAFNKQMRQIALSTQNDSRYNRMALNTPEEKAWFKKLMYRLWDRQITRDEFIALGLQKYPTHRYEFEFIANGFQK